MACYVTLCIVYCTAQNDKHNKSIDFEYSSEGREIRKIYLIG